eukprot:scaffold27085_cov66-Phaeocystis_antarctica.AAC.1
MRSKRCVQSADVRASAELKFLVSDACGPKRAPERADPNGSSPLTVAACCHGSSDGRGAKIDGRVAVAKVGRGETQGPLDAKKKHTHHAAGSRGERAPRDADVDGTAADVLEAEAHLLELHRLR